MFSRNLAIYPQADDCRLTIFEEKPNLHKKVTSDMFQNVISFLEDEDLMEILHTDRIFLKEIRKTNRNIFEHACPKCYHTKKFCNCKIKSNCIIFMNISLIIGICSFCFIYPLQAH